MTRSQLLRAAAILAAHKGADDGALARQLIGEGFERGVAYRIVAFLPSAFARPLLEKLGVTNFVDRVSVFTRDGGSFEVALSSQPEYGEALALAREHLQNGVIPRDVYETIALGSAEIDGVNEALDSGHDIEGSTVAIALACSSHADHVIRN